jgi:hypothetical protein
VACPRPISTRDAIPAELLALLQWIVWWSVRGEGRRVKLPNGRFTKALQVQTKPHKLPIDPGVGGLAATTRPATWSSVEEAEAAAQRWSLSGVGFVFTDGDPYSGVDIDNCRNPETGEIVEWAWAIVRELDSYTEASPSGTGVHIIVRGNLPAGQGNQVAYRGGKVEMFSRARYFTVSGERVTGAPAEIGDRQSALLALHGRLFGPRKAPNPGADRPRTMTLSASDEELIERARHARNGTKFQRLWNGYWEGDYPSQSEADLALCSLLAFWTGKDRARMDGLFRRSGLMRKKWMRADYREETLSRAIEITGETWRPGDYMPRVEAVEDDPRPTPNAPGVAPGWPKALEPEAFHGLAGEIVRMIEPHTEADTAALLIQFLVAFGNLIGRTAFFPAGADRHYTNEFAVLVGASSKGRKGSSWSAITHVLGMADQQWLDRCNQTGLSSGEGLIWAVRDAIESREAMHGKGRKVTGYQTVIKDHGIEDKRLMVVEPEFSSPLRVAERDGNTLSPVIRHAWDNGKLSVLSKNSPARATDAQVSIVGHISQDELLKYLNGCEAANGFANRFLWVAVKRSKELPDGGSLQTVDFAPTIRRLSDAVSFARTVGEMKRDEAARELWHELYGQLSRDRFGLFGVVTSRAEAHVLRLSCLYALLDCSAVVRFPHLVGALEVWRCCEDSCRFIFGDALGDATADTIRAALRRNPGGLTRTEISNLFERHKTAEEVTRTLELLRAQGMARSSSVTTAGRSAERWFAV